jgi:hypothetical protein
MDMGINIPTDTDELSFIHMFSTESVKFLGSV